MASRLLVNAAAVATITLTSLASIAPASSQTNAANKSDLQKRGFTVADFKAAEKTQVEPHYARFVAWKTCAKDGAYIGVGTAQTSDQTIAFIKSACSNEALRLRASIGQELGLTQAQRVIDLLVADEELSLRRRIPPVTPGKPGTRQIGSWMLTTSSPQTCAALNYSNGILGSVFLLKKDGIIRLGIRTKVVQPAPSAASNNRIVIGASPQPIQLTGPFIVEPIGGETWILGVLQPNEIAALKYSGVVVVKPEGEPGASSTGYDERHDIDMYYVIDGMKTC